MRKQYLIAALAWALASCGGSQSNRLLGASSPDSYSWLEAREAYPRPGEGAFDLRWHEQITDRFESKYIPVELGTAGFDPSRNRIYVGTTEGNLFGFQLNGRRDFVYEVGAPVEAQPTADFDGGVLVPAVDGHLHALDASGELRWKADLSGALRNAPVVTDDAVYVIGENDVVTAVARDDGRILWTYEKEPIEEITIAGHAGLLLEDGRIYTAFTDGSVAAIDAIDGRLLWELDTSIDVDLRPGDVPQFLDVDTTPVLIDGLLYVASFNAGLYALDAQSGTVQWREPQLGGIVALAAAGAMLVVASARRGVMLFDPAAREVRWERANERGAPTQPVVTDFGTVIYGETQGSLLALRLSDGAELARAESGYGFSGAPAALGTVGAALSNGGNFLCLRIH